MRGEPVESANETKIRAVSPNWLDSKSSVWLPNEQRARQVILRYSVQTNANLSNDLTREELPENIPTQKNSDQQNKDPSFFAKPLVLSACSPEFVVDKNSSGYLIVDSRPFNLPEL